MQGWREIIEVLDTHPSICVVLASLFTTIIAGLFAFFSTWYIRRSEELRLRSDIAVRIGVESLKSSLEFVKSSPVEYKTLPLEYWILCSAKLAELISMKNITTEIAKTNHAVIMELLLRFTYRFALLSRVNSDITIPPHLGQQRKVSYLPHIP